jgi:chemotaxis protein MotB
MRLVSIAVLFGALGCAATVPETEHKAALRAQQTDYEHRLRRAEEARQRAEQLGAEQAVDATRRRQAMLERVHALESALAQKQRLWDESVRGGSESSALAGSSLGGALGRLLGVEVESGRVGAVLVLHLPLDVFFEPGSIRLRKTAAAAIPAMAKELSGGGKHRIELRVGADDLRPMEEEGPGPFELSAMQSVALGGALVDAGLDPSLLRLTALGAGAPRSDNDSPEGRTRNRRLELRLEPVGPPSRSRSPTRSGG